MTQWIQDSNHLGQMATTIENNGFTGDIAGLVQQIQTYATNSNAFDQAQGGLWSARFWNEFRTDGTSGTAAAALIEGLQNHNAGEVNAAVEQLAANSGDVGTNNLMADGGSYAAVVAAAQATAVTPVAPGDGGGGAGGGGGTATGGGGGGGGGGAAQALVAGDLYFENMFNDATRILEGGLWHNNVPVGNQGNGTDGRYIADLQAVQTGLTADVAAGDFTGDQLTHVNTVLADIKTALAAVPGAVNNDAAAEAALRTAHLDIINTIENDPILQALSIKDDNPGFNFAPPELATPLNANTPHATFAELGAIFDDAQSKSLGGINADNLAAIQADLQTVHDGLLTLMQDHPQIVRRRDRYPRLHHRRSDQSPADQLRPSIRVQSRRGEGDQRQSPRHHRYRCRRRQPCQHGIRQRRHTDGRRPRSPTSCRCPIRTMPPRPTSGPTSSPPATRSAPRPSSWSRPATHRRSAPSSRRCKAGSTTSPNFDAAQGGIFEARFDNELLGKDSTVGADVAAMIQGLQTHNAALVTAAAEGFHANAADVSGNNVPLNGGTYNADGLTVADALSTATAPLPPAPVTPLTPAAPAAPPSSRRGAALRPQRAVAGADDARARRRAHRSSASGPCPNWRISSFTTCGDSGARHGFQRLLRRSGGAGGRSHQDQYGVRRS